MRRLLWLVLALVPAAAAQPYAIVEDAAGDQAPFAGAKFDILQVLVEGDERNLTVAVTMSDDVRQQRGQHAVGIRGGGFHVHVACYIGQTSPVADDPVQCAATDVHRDGEDPVPAGVTQPFAEGDPVFSDGGRTWNFTFSREAGDVPVGATADRIYAQSKMSLRLDGAETSPGTAGYSEADNAASNEYIDLGDPQAEDAPGSPSETPAREAPGPLLLLPIAAALLVRRR